MVIDGLLTFKEDKIKLFAAKFYKMLSKCKIVNRLTTAVIFNGSYHLLKVMYGECHIQLQSLTFYFFHL